HRANLHSGSATAAEASVRAARASAGLDGAGLDLPDETDGIVTDPLLAGTLRIAEASEALLATWRRAPAQALARMHVLAAKDLIQDPDNLGRPRPEVDN